VGTGHNIAADERGIGGSKRGSFKLGNPNGESIAGKGSVAQRAVVNSIADRFAGDLAPNLGEKRCFPASHPSF
jgi:hypothetical protein